MLAARTVLLLALLLAFALQHATAHFTPIECCSKYAQKLVRQVESFYETPRDCALPAVVIVAGTGDHICVNPKAAWVKKAIKKLQRKK